MAENGTNGHVPENEQVAEDEESVDLGAEFAALGRKFADAMKSTLESDEAKRIEGEFRKGMKAFTDEVEKGFDNIRSSEPVQRVEENVKKVGEEVENSRVMSEAREGMLKALRSLSKALDDLAHNMDKQSPEEKPSE